MRLETSTVCDFINNSENKTTYGEVETSIELSALFVAHGSPWLFGRQTILNSIVFQNHFLPLGSYVEFCFIMFC